MQATVGGRRSDVDARKEGLPWRPRFSAQHPQPRVGLGLLPFFLACAVYLLVQRSVDQPSRVSALLKSLPVLYLAGLLGTAHPGGGYRSLLQAALLCSAVGDACLVWPEAFLHDAVLAWNTFFHQLPHGHLLVMTTYYLAQMLIALSAFQSPRLKSH
ncbi:lysoplasmalogenase TMEM86B isoform X3 [Dama dama]|uniref:lysoplasmalogenase TMEM86B isoform X3 n=1 Tax=Dama dama TaxID=30532 RepID=UPI002A36D123|nr:lysoplasmalogenase TMEM86B isoform X3 [Dama dama]